MFKIIYISLLTALTFRVCASIPNELSVDQVKSVPLLLHNDAREFYRKMNPLVDHESSHYSGQYLKNPYELYMEAMIFGKLFGVLLPENTDTCLQESIGCILNSNDQERNYLLLPIAQAALSQNISNTNTMQYHTAFNGKFETILDEMFLDKNLFSYFVKGLMNYELGVMNYNHDQKQLGEKYITIAADGYVFPALSFLQWKYKDNRENTHFTRLVEEKIKHLRKLDLNQLPLNVIKYQIECGLTNDLYARYLPKKYKVSDDCAVDYVRKLRDSAHTVQGFNRGFYDGVLRHLKKTTGSMRRASAFTTSSYAWRLITLGGAAASTAFSGVSVWYGMTHSTANQEMSDETELMINTMVRNSFITGIASCLSFGYNCYLTYNSPRLLMINEIDLNKEIELTALYWSLRHDMNDAHEVVADEIIDLWFKQKWELSRRQITLSQLSLTR